MLNGSRIVNDFLLFKVACVVKLKLAFMECFFYNLVMLIKLYKIRYIYLDKALSFQRNQQPTRAPTIIEFNIFC